MIAPLLMFLRSSGHRAYIAERRRRAEAELRAREEIELYEKKVEQKEAEYDTEYDPEFNDSGDLG